MDQITFFISPGSVGTHKLGEVEMKPSLQADISLKYFYQNLLKSDSVWPSYGGWKTGMFSWDTV